MKLFRFFIWAGFIAIILVFVYYYRVASPYNVPGVSALERAGFTEGKAILASWQNASLFAIVRKATYYDFAFIFFYTSLLIILSNRQIRKESSVTLNMLLRTNFFLAFLAALFDVTENVFLLYNICHWDDTNYINSSFVTWAKLILIAWVVLVWLVSVIKSMVTK
jgi:hypothetical protein